ncbi:MAG: P1 family peptidase [Flavobacteriaceae bacterium]
MRQQIQYLSYILSVFFLLQVFLGFSQNKRARDYGIQIGVFETGPLNAITDVAGVAVGHQTIREGNQVRTGVTAILPHSKDVFQNKVPAAIYIGNGFGKLMGYSQVKELGNIETPIVLTNTLSVPVAGAALLSYTLEKPGNEQIRSVNPIVGETNDGYLNDIRGRHIKEKDVLEALQSAQGGPVAEGNVGAGTGTVCFGFKGGIGTASRKIPRSLGGYTVGVLVQTNFGGVLEINGVPIGQELNKFSFDKAVLNDVDGSCMIVVITDAPLGSRNLERVAKRALMGLAKTGGIASNGSGDYVIALSVDETNIRELAKTSNQYHKSVLKNEAMSPVFMATIEATEEAIINSLFAAETTLGKEGRQIQSLPIQKVLRIMKKYNKIN